MSSCLLVERNCEYVVEEMITDMTSVLKNARSLGAHVRGAENLKHFLPVGEHDARIVLLQLLLEFSEVAGKQQTLAEASTAKINSRKRTIDATEETCPCRGPD